VFFALFVAATIALEKTPRRRDALGVVTASGLFAYALSQGCDVRGSRNIIAA
jgi:hypothetical protein